MPGAQPQAGLVEFRRPHWEDSESNDRRTECEIGRLDRALRVSKGAALPTHTQGGSRGMRYYAVTKTLNV